eukprot:359300-Chlamydomonas_euryale.AAC.9
MHNPSSATQVGRTRLHVKHAVQDLAERRIAAAEVLNRGKSQGSHTTLQCTHPHSARATAAVFGPGGKNLGLEAEAWAWKPTPEPRGRSLGLEAEVWA